MMTRHTHKPAPHPEPIRRHRLRAILTLVFSAVSAAALAGTGASEQDPAPAVVLRLQDGLLSAHIVDAPLAEVMAKLAEQAPVRASVAEAVREEKVSATFDALPLAEGIARILKGMSYLLSPLPAREQADAGSAGPQQAIMVVFVLGVGQDGPLAGVGTAQAKPRLARTSARPKRGRHDDEDQAPRPELSEQERLAQVAELSKRALQASEPQVRAQALRGLVHLDQGGETLSTVVTALRADAAPQVRAQAVQLLDQTLTPTPRDLLVDTALSDDSPEVRLEALRLLAFEDRQAALAPLQKAARDADPELSGHAQKLLDWIRAADHPEAPR